MALGDGTAWDETTPTNSSNANDIDDFNRDLRKGIRIRMEYEHDALVGSSGGGKHKFITLQQQSAKPTLSGSQVAALYTKDDGASDQDLFFEREDAVEMQLTDGDFLNPEMADYWEFANQSSAPSTAANKGAIYTKDAGGQPELFFREESDGDEVQITSGGSLKGGVILQIVKSEDKTERSLTVTKGIPNDDTKPQSDEGAAYSEMDVAITAESTGNTLEVDANLNGAVTDGNGQMLVICLFRDSETDAIAVAIGGVNTNGFGAVNYNPRILVKFTPADTNAHTYKIRVGISTGTGNPNMNAHTGANYGSLFVSSMTIRELKGSI